MRWVLVSLVVHAILIAWLASDHEQLVAWAPPQLPTYPPAEEVATVVELVDAPGGGGGIGATTATRAARTAIAPKRSADPWEHITVSMDAASAANADGSSRDRQAAGAGSGNGGGAGGGDGTGRGNGIGFGAGGGVRIADDVPAPPPPPPPKVSKARPAKLVWPTRDEEVDDDASLFAAKVTVDADGDVIAARMLTLRIGAKADRAASAIWSFRYAPALDEDGHAIASTFEQSFQVR